MNTMPRIPAALLLIALAIGPACPARAQFAREYAPWPVVVSDTLLLPFWGGINDPKPSLIDLDGDGRVDLFLGEIRGKLGYLRNTGSAAVPAWTPESGRFAGLDIGTWHAFCDIDADGDPDLFADSRNGLTSFYRNTTGGPQPSFALEGAAYGGFQTGQNNTCAFADIDGDGDFDFFFGNLAGGLSLWRNIGDSVNAAFVFETDTYDSIFALPGGLAAAERHHGFSNVRFADIDGDLDLDCFYGDIFNFNLYYFRNDGTPTASNLTRITETYLPVSTAGFNHAAFADLDGDGDLDLLVGAANGQDLDNLIYFRNDGTAAAANFTAVTLNYLSNLDVGSYSVPALGDLDADGDYDLLIGTGDGHIWQFVNTGTPNAPVWVRTSAALAGIDVGLSAIPELVDWDSDGDLDLLVGTENGRIQYWRNDGTAKSLQLVQADAQLGGIQVDRLAVPRAVDWNTDGLLDLVVGEWDFNGLANLRLYRNVGTPGAPVLSLQAFELLPVAFREFTLPQIYDWDGDGRDDLILGGRFFGLSIYRNVAPEDSFPDSTTLVLQPDSLEAGDSGYRLAASFADIDSDGDADLFVGEEDGGLNFFRHAGGTPFRRGDVNVSGTISSADIIYLVNYVFKAGPDPQPVPTAGDVNCSGNITSADIIQLVNYVFKAGPGPCIE
jgi:hypothetical protein